MSTATTPDKTDRYVDFDEYVDFQLEKTRKSIKSNDLLTASAAAAALVLAGLLTFVVLDHWVVPGGFSVTARWCWFLGYAGLVVGWLVWKVGVPALWTVNRLFAAKELEQADPALKGNLLNWADLRAAGRSVNPSIMQTIEKQAATELSKMDVGQAVDHRPLLNASYALLAIVVLFCGYALLSPKKISSALWRMLPFTESGAVTRTVIQEVTPGDFTLLARGQLEVGVLVGGEIPGEVQMLYSTADGRVQDEAVVLRPQTEGLPRFRGIFAGESGSGVLQDFSYVIVAGDARSARYHVTVHHPPSAAVHQVSLNCPDYMKLDEVKSLGGHIDGWEGATATISATADQPCRSAVLQFLNDSQSPPTGEEVPVQVSDGTQLTATWKLDFRSDGTFPKHYRIQCRNDAGEVDPSPAVYNIAIKPDRPPEVVLLYPERDLEAPANAVIPLLVQAGDPDFELGYVNLQAEKDGQSIHRYQLSEGRQQSVTLKHNFELSALALRPGDDIQFWVEAFDNKQPRRNRKNTPRLKIRIVEPVSKEEAQDQLAEAQQERDERLAEAQQEQNRNEDRQAEADSNDADDREERDPMERESAEARSKADQQDDPTQDGGSKTANSREKSQSDPNAPSHKAKGSDTDKGDAGNDADSQESPLSDDGDDDHEALRRLNDRLNQNADRPSHTPNSDEKNQNQPSQSKPSPMRNDPSADEDSTATNDSETGETEPNEQQTAPKPGKNSPRTGDEKSANAASQPGDEDASDKADETKPPGESDADSQPRPGQKDERNAKNSRGKTPKGEDSKTEPMTDDKDSTARPDGSKPADEAKNNSATGRKPPNSETKDDKSLTKHPPSANSDADEGDNSVPTPEEDQTTGKSSDPKAKSGKEPSSPKDHEPKKPSGKQPKDSKADKPGENSDASPDEKKNPDRENASDDAESPDSEKNASSNKSNSNQNKNSPSKPGKSSKSKSPNSSGSPESSPSSDAEPSESEGDDSESSSDSPSSPSPSKSKPSAKSGKNQQPKNTSAQKQPGKTKPGDQDSATGDDAASDSPSENDSDGSENKRPGEGSDADSDQPMPKLKSQPKTGKDNPNAAKTELENGEDVPKGKKPSPKARQKTEGDPNAAEEELKGPGEPEGQKSDQPDGGEAGGSNQDKEGNPGSQTEGPGVQTDQPGDETVSDKQTGKSDPKSRPGEGSKSKAGGKDGGEKPGGKAGQTDGKKPGKQDAQPPGGEQGSEPSDAESGSEPAESGSDSSSGAPQDGAPSTKPGSSEGKSKVQGSTPGKSPGNGPKPGGKKPSDSGNPLGGGSTENGDVGGDGTAEATEADPEAANLEYNRQAAELVLQRLKDDLNHDTIDPKLLEELGWTPEQLQRFVNRLARQLEKPVDELTPQDEARRRQFEEMLKSLDLKNAGAKRSGENTPSREVDQSGARRAPVPAEYKASWEALTKSLSKKNAPGKKETETAPKRR